MGYWIAAGLMALWLLRDARQRRYGSSGFLWAIGTLLFPFVALPSYLAVRPLRAGETRRGGKPWNLLKQFARTWTILMLAVGVSTAVELGVGLSGRSEAEQGEYAFGSALGLGVIVLNWFFPTLGALVLGFFLRKSSVIERGPTGRLASSGPPERARA